MKLKLLLLALFSLLAHLTCSTTGQMLPEPLPGQNLIIGSLLLDIDGYQDNFASIEKNIEVAIIGRYEKDGQIQRFGQWATTDENGYFYLPNIPAGEYAIKGFKTRWSGLGDLTIANELVDPQRNYYERLESDIIPFTGDLLQVRSDRGVINFGHNIFTLHRSGIVRLQHYDRVRDVKLATGEIIQKPPVPYYFAEKFADTGWENILNLHLK
ncbi:MAG: carboxypeptidase-like regulatory domain-containing protein [candidate division KSB1 bacterium]|nr:carboxypeptidase-like regulatory domain-containing protein [candidate division KSB1 bacterium]MDZ7319238.1 carboxypeptidase-like regulatory domain-containing protein [candidate division KSB1 bacterium]MDZ7340596.1 carboxypeptidase-like regulatory domain-containing protein [candidate division KSB1 bacterium]